MSEVTAASIVMLLIIVWFGWLISVFVGWLRGVEDTPSERLGMAKCVLIGWWACHRVRHLSTRRVVGNLGRINHSARSALDAIFGRSWAHPRLASAPAET